VALAIWDLSSLTKSRTVALAARHRDVFGVKRHSANRALRELEQAGLVTVERKIGRAPRVTIDKKFFPR